MFKKNMLQTTYYQLPARRGFTLIEVLVSIVILVVVIGGIVALEVGNIRTGTSSKFVLQANGLGQEGMNLVKAIGDKAKLGGSTGGVCSDPNNSTSCPAGFYYLNNSNILTTCNTCKNTQDGSTHGCPTGSSVNDSTKLICVDEGSQKTINGKVFNRTVIIPYKAPDSTN